ncbi:MAG: glycosyltransferase family 39 protein [Chloroflexi bacterium]|nr:glycosyltransferase family 39 protein [Chloroflexota bacterium]
MASLQNQKAKLALVLIFAFLIRLAGISSRPIWYDEAFSILISEQGPSTILAGTLAIDSDSSAAEEHPPAYYFTLWGWMQVFGNSLTAVRLLSIMISLGIILCVYLIASHLLDSPAALSAAFISAILPFQVHYGQEIRMYVLLTFWLCLATLALLKRQWILFSIAAALAQYTHNLAAFYLIPLALTPIFQKDWKTLRSLTLAGFASIIIYSPWLIQLPAQFSKVTHGFWVERPGIEKIFTLILIYIPHLPLPNDWLPLGLLFSTLTITLAAFQTYRTTRDDLSQARIGLWLAYLSFAPPMLLWLVSQKWPVYVERALLPSHAIFCIWLAWAFTKSKLPHQIQILAFALIFASAGIGLYQHVAYKGFPYGAFPQINKSIIGRYQPGDVVIHSSKLSYLPSFYFDRDLPMSYITEPSGSSTDTLSPFTREVLHLSGNENIESATSAAVRVWFIIYQKSMDELTAQGFKTHPQLEYLDQYFKLESVDSWDEVNVYQYQSPP